MEYAIAVVRRDRFQRALAFVGAVGTLALGTTADVFQFDGLGAPRSKRFRCVTPKRVRAALRLWAARRTRASVEAVVLAWRVGTERIEALRRGAEVRRKPERKR